MRKTLGKLAFVLATAAATAGAEQAAGAVVQHTVVPQDTMWDLAEHYYKDHFKWRRISEANPPPKIHDPHWIYPGQILLIPDLDGEAAAPAPAVATAPGPVEASASPPAPEPPPPPAPEPAQAPDAEKTPDHHGLSATLPEGLVSTDIRLKASRSWKADGEVTGFDGTEIMAAEGDLIDVRLDSGPAAPGKRYRVLRKAAPEEGDADPNATYLTRVGSIALKRSLGEKLYRAVILKSNDSLQLGDLVERAD